MDINEAARGKGEDMADHELAGAVTGVAAGVPYVALPPPGGGAAPLVVGWHLMDAPRTESAFAAALPLTGLPAWRVYLGLPMFGARMPAGGPQEVLRLAAEDYLLNVLGPVVEQAVAELPAALDAVRAALPAADGPIGVLGGSAGAVVALLAMAESPVPIAAGAVVNPATPVEPVIAVGEAMFDVVYRWSEASRSVARRLDFTARAAEVVGPGPGRPVLVASGDRDEPGMRDGAAKLAAALAAASGRPELTRLTRVLDLPHALADEPGLAPAPQWPAVAGLDAEIVAFFRASLPGLPAS